MSAKKDRRKIERQQQRRLEKSALKLAESKIPNNIPPKWDFEYLFHEDCYHFPHTDVDEIMSVLEKCKNFSTMTVAEMMRNGDTLLCYPPDYKPRLCEKVQKKLDDNKEYSSLFNGDGIWRFRLQGSHRLYAFRINSSDFKVVWWDPNHEIYPQER